jgi:hypothetical protein
VEAAEDPAVAAATEEAAEEIVESAATVENVAIAGTVENAPGLMEERLRSATRSAERYVSFIFF